MEDYDTPDNVDAGENRQKFQKPTESKPRYIKGV